MLSRSLLSCVALVVGISAALAFGAEKAARPNVIFILADDLGYGDLGCFGQKQIETPNLDRMAAEGMRFTDFYAGSTVCAPSRCVLMTGYHTGHCVIRGNSRQDLQPSDVTVAEVLKSAGYTCGLIGKWGLGTEGGVGAPNKQGFDFFYGYLDQHHAHNHYPAFLMRNEGREQLENAVPGGGMFGSGVATKKVQYSQDLFLAEALKFIDAHKAGPFFLYLALTTPHANNEAKDKGMEVPDFGIYQDKDWPAPQKGHAAMISHLDAGVGKVLARLKELGIDDRTLVFLSSDNGPHREGGNDPAFNDSNGPLRGIKRDLTDGGIRVPTIARWPGQVQAGAVSDFVGGFQDILPTLAELSGAERRQWPADIDGLSLVPTLLGRGEQTQHDHLYWVFYEAGAARALRSGPWKVVEQPLGSPVRLYDLRDDIGEERDLSSQHATEVQQLVKGMDAAYRPSDYYKLPLPKPRP